MKYKNRNRKSVQPATYINWEVVNPTLYAKKKEKTPEVVRFTRGRYRGQEPREVCSGYLHNLLNDWGRHPEILDRNKELVAEIQCVLRSRGEIDSLSLDYQLLEDPDFFLPPWSGTHTF